MGERMMQVSRREFRIAVALMLSACGGTNAMPNDGSTGDGSSGDAGPIEVVDGRPTFPGCSDAFGASSEGTPGSPVRIPFGDAPHTGGVDPDQGSSYEYLVSGVPAGLVSVTLIDADDPVGYSAWAADSPVIDCSGGVATFPRCTLTASAAALRRKRPALRRKRHSAENVRPGSFQAGTWEGPGLLAFDVVGCG